jgi:hypothetical protein
MIQCKMMNADSRVCGQKKTGGDAESWTVYPACLIGIFFTSPGLRVAARTAFFTCIAGRRAAFSL